MVIFQMKSQISGMSKNFQTDLANVGFLAIVLSLMRFQIARFFEFHIAIFVQAPEVQVIKAGGGVKHLKGLIFIWSQPRNYSLFVGIAQWVEVCLGALVSEFVLWFISFINKYRHFFHIFMYRSLHINLWRGHCTIFDEFLVLGPLWAKMNFFIFRIKHIDSQKWHGQLTLVVNQRQLPCFADLSLGWLGKWVVTF